MASVTSIVSLLPSGANGPAEQEEGRCSGGDTHHSASESVLWNERHVTKTGPNSQNGRFLSNNCRCLAASCCQMFSLAYSTWWEGSGRDGRHHHPSGGWWHIGHLLPVLSIQTPAAGNVWKHWSGVGAHTGPRQQPVTSVTHSKCCIFLNAGVTLLW